MNKGKLIDYVVKTMKENDIRKKVKTPKATLHISDDSGNRKDFTIKRTEKGVYLNKIDVENVIDSFLYNIEEALKRGESVTLHGFGSFSVRYRQPSFTKHPVTGERVFIEGHYVPKFSMGNDLKLCAKVFEESQNDKQAVSDAEEVLEEHRVEKGGE